MEQYIYQNTLISKKQLKNLLGWCFTKYGAVQASLLADELKNLGFKYATQAGISISIEDLQVPPVKSSILSKAENEITTAEKILLKGKTTEVERFQKVIATWTITSENLKDEVVTYFKTYDPLNSVYMMAFSGARGNLSQVHQLVGMRGLMSDPSGEIIDLPIIKNFREGLQITDYLISGYGARKGIVDTALKTANSGYLTRRLIDVAHDIIIREKDCATNYSIIFINQKNNKKITNSFYERIVGRLLNKNVYDPVNQKLLAKVNEQITPNLIRVFKQHKIETLFFRSPLTCNLNRSICQKCYGWNLSTENLVDLGEAVGIIAGQSIGEPGTQLTMRTFHTGGIFTAGANKPIISPINGTIQFSDILKTSIIRTSRGENVLVTENSGQLFFVPEDKSAKKISIYIPSNSMLFIHKNEYVTKNSVIGQLIENTQQTKLERKNIFSNFSGEVQLWNKSQNDKKTKEKLIWLFAGQVYNIPTQAFINLYKDYIINKNNYIFRIKLINKHAGFIKITNNKIDLSQQIIEVFNCFNDFPTLKIQQLDRFINSHNYVFKVKNENYLITLKNNLNTNINTEATLISNNFLTKTGGIPYQNEKHSTEYLNKTNRKIKRKRNNTIIWLPEETFILNRDRSLLLVENNEFIAENYEVVPNIFSKSTGIVKIISKQNIILEVIIKPGRLIQLNLENPKEATNYHKKIFFPGEYLEFTDQTVKIESPVFCEILETSQGLQLEIRTLQLFEISRPKSIRKIFERPLKKDCNFKILPIMIRNFNYNEKIKISKNYNLVLQKLRFEFSNRDILQNKIETRFIPNRNKNNRLEFISSEKFYINHYIPISLKYKNIKLALLVENNQFINAYTTLGYLEIVTQKYLELVQIKSRGNKSKKLLIISKDDCITIPKSSLDSNKTNDYQIILDQKKQNKIGKYLKETENYLLLQKGRPYFFPNCQNLNEQQTKVEKRKVKKREIQKIPVPTLFKRNDLIIKYTDNKTRPKHLTEILLNNLDYKIFYTKRFIKTNKERVLGINFNPKLTKYQKKKKNINFLNYSINQFYLYKNGYKTVENSKPLELKQNFANITSVKNNYFESDQNQVFCKNGEFIEEGHTLGLLNFEKEVTGDIVQGLPRIEQLLEARKIESKEQEILENFKQNPKKRLIILNSRLDATFEFKKMMSTFDVETNLNPHLLLTFYFDQYTNIKETRFINNRLKVNSRFDLYQGTYRSFKKVQDLILNSVQNVYQSQGVTIADKHLEIIIKQMTSKVKIFKEGDTPLLPLEIIDLYQINYMNKIISQNQVSNSEKNICRPALYRPILFGITKTALNSPSFISAASFQDTTRVLTKAAIEGRVDWLRGLKENVVIGHLIPAGTGYTKYSKSFTI
jgi:DNA-directed RNA polymerase subunit beta'